MKLHITIFLGLLIIGCAKTEIKLNSSKYFSNDEFEITKISETEAIWFREQSFKDAREALNYILDRRLTIQRFHQLSAEPYFGTPEQKKCEDNIDVSGDIIPILNGKYFRVQVLVNQYYSMGDCLRENNTQNAFYEFFACKNGKVAEIRHYRAYEAIKPKPKQYDCKI